MSEHVEVEIVTPETETAVPESGDQTVVIAPGSDPLSPMVAIAETLGRIETRIQHLEERQSETETVAEQAADSAEAAVGIAVDAVEEAATAADAAIETVTDAIEAASEPDQPPQREHWFFKQLKVSS